VQLCGTNEIRLYGTASTLLAPFGTCARCCLVTPKQLSFDANWLRHLKPQTFVNAKHGRGRWHRAKVLATSADHDRVQVKWDPCRLPACDCCTFGAVDFGISGHSGNQWIPNTRLAVDGEHRQASTWCGKTLKGARFALTAGQLSFAPALWERKDGKQRASCESVAWQGFDLSQRGCLDFANRFCGYDGARVAACDLDNSDTLFVHVRDRLGANFVHAYCVAAVMDGKPQSALFLGELELDGYSAYDLHAIGPGLVLWGRAHIGSIYQEKR